MLCCVAQLRCTTSSSSCMPAASSSTLTLRAVRHSEAGCRILKPCGEDLQKQGPVPDIGAATFCRLAAGV